MEPKNAAGQISLFIDYGEQKGVGVHVIIHRVGDKHAAIDVVHGLIEIEKVEKQVSMKTTVLPSEAVLVT